MTHHFTVTGIPRSGKNSSRHAINTKTGRRFTLKSKAAAEWLGNAIMQLARQRPRSLRIIDTPVTIDLAIFHALPLEHFDGDNVVNLVHDALKKALILKDDNARIVRRGAFECHVDTDNPRVEITITPWHARAVA